MTKQRIFLVLVICAILGFMAVPNARADTITEQYFEGTITEFYNYYDEYGNPVPEATIEFDLDEGLVEIEFGWKPFKFDMDAYMYMDGMWIPWWEIDLATAGNPERDIYYADAGHYTLDLEFWVAQLYEPWNMAPPDKTDWWVIVRQPPEGDERTGGTVHAFPHVPRRMHENNLPMSETNIVYPKQVISHISLNDMTGYATHEFLANEAHVVGLFAYGINPAYFESDKETKAWLDSWTYSIYIDGQPLESLTQVKDGPIRKDHTNGLYYKRYEHGIFNAGELAGLIGTGEHTYRIVEYQYGVETGWFFESYFCLV
ncbi:MAG: hypothetical protein ACFFF9_08655 [Candidatus Thorarchaeota archaeon]